MRRVSTSPAHVRESTEKMEGETITQSQQNEASSTVKAQLKLATYMKEFLENYGL